MNIHRIGDSKLKLYHYQDMGNTRGRPLKFTSAQEIWDKAQAYFKKQDELGMPYTITGVANWLDTSRETLCEYSERDDFVDTIKKIKGIVEEYAEKQLFVGKNVAGPIFALKNHGWSDKQEVEQSGKDGGPIQHEVGMTPELLAAAMKKFKESI